MKEKGLREKKQFEGKTLKERVLEKNKRTF